MSYNGLKASNVFVSSDGNVQLGEWLSDTETQLRVAANFGPTLTPRLRDPSSRNPDCEDVAHLAYYMLSRRPKLLSHPGTLPQQMVRVADFYLDTDVTPQFLAFLETCICAVNVADLARVG